jgi:aminoglycoside phosphotransferase family enzyme/predicted kinase
MQGDDLDQWLAAGAGEACPCDRRIETPISKVYLYPDRALKRKKPVDFGFLDFTTLAKRLWAGQQELRLNRITAPDVYRALHAVVPGPFGFRLAPADAPDAVDYVLEMRRFDETAVLSECPDRVDGDLAEDIGREIARVHGAAAQGTAGGGADGLDYVLKSNASHLRQLAPVLGEAAVERVIASTEAVFAAQRTRLDRRLARGLVRECHGDLHLGNILLEDGRAVLFDRIEFNVRLIEIDVLYDLAFTLMDLVFRGRPGPANRALNGWLDAAARTLPVDELHDGLAALPLFLSVRAAVRCHVCGHNGQPDAARAYLAAAEAHLQTVPPRLIAIGGLSGSGKSTLSRALAPGLGAPPGAVVLRSDEVRKRLFGRAPTEPLPPEAYAPEADARIHAALFDGAARVLDAGTSVILDATFRDPARRAEALALHPAAVGVWLDAPDAVLRARVAARHNDASDADLAVLERQLAHRPKVADWRQVDAAAPLDAQCASVLAG